MGVSVWSSHPRVEAVQKGGIKCDVGPLAEHHGRWVPDAAGVTRPWRGSAGCVPRLPAVGPLLCLPWPPGPPAPGQARGRVCSLKQSAVRGSPIPPTPDVGMDTGSAVDTLGALMSAQASGLPQLSRPPPSPSTPLQSSDGP